MSTTEAQVIAHPSRMGTHLTVLAALHIANSLLVLFAAAIVFVTLGVTGLLANDPEATPILVPLGTLIALFLTVLALPGLIGGMGLLRHQNWARIVLLIVGAINIINIPVGTALAAYTFWVLLQEETVRLLTPDAGALSTSVRNAA